MREITIELPSKSLIDKLREKFLTEFSTRRDCFDSIDFENVELNDWFIMRFLIHTGLDEDAAYEMIVNAMFWRKEQDLRSVRDNYFPDLFYQTGGLFAYEPDKCGRPTLFVRVKYVKKLPELSATMKKFLIHQIFKIDEQSNGNGWALIFDFTDAGVSNCDLDLVSFLIMILRTYFPVGVHYLLTFELPWILNAFSKLVMSWMPMESRELMKFVDKNTIIDYIDKENLPDFAGGSCKRLYRDVPEGCPTAEIFGEVIGISPKSVKKIMEKYKPLIEVN